MIQPTILLVDDDAAIVDTLAYNLRRESYRVLIAGDGPTAIRIAYDELPDLIVLDLMLPQMNGFEVCTVVRRKLAVPILILTALEGEQERVRGLDLGADAYLTKPFKLREFMAHVRAMLRRGGVQGTGTPGVTAEYGDTTADSQPVSLPANPVRIKDVTIDLAGHTVFRHGKVVHLKPKEFELLAFLVRNPNQVFSRATLLDKVWGYEFSGGSRTVDVHMSWLRSKLEPNVATPQLFQTVYGVGYKLATMNGHGLADGIADF